MAAGRVAAPLLPQILQRRFVPPRYRLVGDYPVMRSASRLTVDDHYCTYIPTFTFDANVRFTISDNFERFNVDAANRFTWFVELNPQANPC